jgi:hypothetical protein
MRVCVTQRFLVEADFVNLFYSFMLSSVDQLILVPDVCGFCFPLAGEVVSDLLVVDFPYEDSLNDEKNLGHLQTIVMRRSSAFY